MKNFPSALIKQQSTKNGLGSNVSSTLKNIGSQVISDVLGNSNAKAFDNEFMRGYERPELDHLIDEYNIFEEKQSIIDIEKKINEPVNLKYNTQNGLSKNDNDVTFEDPFKFSSSIFSVINNYNYILAASAPNLYEVGHFEVDEKTEQITNVDLSVINTAISPSLFNPYAGVSITGFTENIPLIDRKVDKISNDTVKSGATDLSDGSIKLTNTIWSERNDLSDCSIKTLVEKSQGNPPELGLATYRYIDFMYCKDLGKIPNNRLITLRRFPVPVGDNIFRDAHPNNTDKLANKLLKGVPDIGRLITWFDNDDNKLENICRYNYHATWKEFTSEIQQQSRNERDDGLVTKLANFFSPQNNELVLKGFSGNTGIFGMAASAIGLKNVQGSNASQPYYDLQTLTNYDKNKIYEPQDRIWSTHKYEGRLEFSQEITLVFRYQLRSYSNINPRAALMDLIGNIQTVTYRRGSFWGGEIKMYGPQSNSSVFAKANAWIDKGFDTLGGIWTRLKGGDFTMESLQNWIESAINKSGEILKGAYNKAQEVTGGQGGNSGDNGSIDKEKIKNFAGQEMDKVEKLAKTYKWGSAMKGMLKNQLGRPQVYALNSLLTGEEVGPWHLTIGNPRNPIMSIGNLILDNAEVQHYGPLGIDDFPTELSVTVTLKHAMPRDSVGIQKMYTKGEGSIYKPMNLMNIDKYWKNDFAFGDVITDSDILKKNLSAL